MDKCKEEIGWLKVVFTVSTALDASLVAWLAQNYSAAHITFVAVGCVMATVFAALVVFACYRIHSNLKAMEDE